MKTSDKKQYTAPKTIVHGSIAQITKSIPSGKVNPGIKDQFTEVPGFGDPTSGQIVPVR